MVTEMISQAIAREETMLLNVITMSKGLETKEWRIEMKIDHRAVSNETRLIVPNIGGLHIATKINRVNELNVGLEVVDSARLHAKTRLDLPVHIEATDSIRDGLSLTDAVDGRESENPDRTGVTSMIDTPETGRAGLIITAPWHHTKRHQGGKDGLDSTTVIGVPKKLTTQKVSDTTLGVDSLMEADTGIVGDIISLAMSDLSDTSTIGFVKAPAVTLDVISVASPKEVNSHETMDIIQIGVILSPIQVVDTGVAGLIKDITASDTMTAAISTIEVTLPLRADISHDGFTAIKSHLEQDKNLNSKHRSADSTPMAMARSPKTKS